VAGARGRLPPGKSASDAVEVLRELMVEHGLTQKGLPEIGSQCVASEILNGKWTLNVRQIQRLAARFGVSLRVLISPP